MTKLSQSEINFFNENGYVGPFDLQPGTNFKLDISVRKKIQKRAINLKKFKRYSDFVKNGEQESPLLTRNMHLYNYEVYKIATMPTIIDKIACLMGDNIFLWKTTFWTKRPNSSIVPWHRDIFQGLGNVGNISCWLALSEVSEDNGCMEVICGSHKDNITEDIFNDEKYLEKQRQSNKLFVPDEISNKRIQKMPLLAGQFFIFDQAIIHGSNANTLQVAREAMVIRFIPTSVEKKLDSPCILLKGKDLEKKQHVLPPPKKNPLSQVFRYRKYKKCRFMMD